MPAEVHHPPCVVLGLETQIGLGVVRELGRAGVRVIGVAQSPRALALRSRYLWRSVTVASPRGPELVEKLRALGQAHGPCPLLAISEVNLLWLQANQDAILPLKAVLPSPSALATVLDKAATLDAARSVGIDVPSTWQPMSHDDIARQAQTFPVPAVLKWSDPNEIAPRLDALDLPVIKTEHVADHPSLAAALGRYDVLGQWPLVQQYCPGFGLGQFFFMHRGQALRRFQHRRIAEWPPEGGISSVADAVPLDRHAELQERSIELLRHIGWEGVAMVEYRHDPSTGRSSLMEINGRFWGSFPLSVHCGAAFSRYSYAASAGLELPSLPPPRSDLRGRMVGTEIKRLNRILRHPEEIMDRSFERRPAHEVMRFLVDFLNPRVRYSVASIDDPGPWIADLANMVRRP